MKHWIGKSIIFICIIHSLFGFVFFASIIAEIFNEKLLNTVNGQTAREAVFWFLFFGFLGILLGVLVNWCESKRITLPKTFGIGLLILTTIAVIIMPISGLWLLFIPAIGAILKT